MRGTAHDKANFPFEAHVEPVRVAGRRWSSGATWVPGDEKALRGLVSGSLGLGKGREWEGRGEGRGEEGDGTPPSNIQIHNAECTI